MPRWVAKFLALIGSFLLPLICTLLPYKLSGCIARRGTYGKRVLSYLMCFGGGIFFGTYLLHMGPEVQTILKHALLDPYEITYPLAELIIGIGFFIVLFAEKLVLRWNKRRIHQRRKASCHLPAPPEINVTKLSNVTKCARSASSDDVCDNCAEGKPCSGYKDRTHGQNKVEDVNQGCQARPDSNALLLSKQVCDIEDMPVCATAVAGPGVSECPMSGTGECCTDSPGEHQELSEKQRQIIVSMKVEDKLTKPPPKELDMEVGSVEMRGGHHHATRSLILILALSLHRIFEGMSIGLQQSVTNVASLFGAVMCHETVIGFSLGLQFVRSGFALRRLLITSFVCSAIMPVGVLIGLVMTEAGSTGSSVDIANGILQAIAMGTFIYVTFFEILQEEVDPEDTSLGKIVSIAAGFALMALLTLIPEGDMVVVGSGSGAFNSSSSAVVNATTSN